MPISEKLLEILACPEDKSPVALADKEVIQSVNTKIRSRSLKNRAGELVDAPIDGGLIRADGKFLYPIRNDIPIMLVEEAIPLD